VVEESFATAAAPVAPAAGGESVRWLTLWTAVGGVAGAAAVVYCVGAGIEALRLNAAGLPVEEAIAVVPKTAMVTLAINALLLRAFIQAVLTGVLLYWLNLRAAAALEPEAVLRRGEKAAARKQRREARGRRLAALGTLLRLVRRMLGRASRAVGVHRAARAVLAFLVFLGEGIIVVWRRTLGHVRHKFWIALALVYAFLLPWTAFTIYGTIIVVVQLNLIVAIGRRRRAGLMTIRTEATLLGAIAAISLTTMTLTGEAIRPGPLPRAAVQVEGAAKPLLGDYVSTTNDGVYLGVHRKLLLIPNHRVSTITIYNAPEQKPEIGRTLIQRLP